MISQNNFTDLRGRTAFLSDDGMILCGNFYSGNHLRIIHSTKIRNSDRPVIILTANSDEVVTALSQMQTPDEMNQGNVYKICLPKRLGYTIQLDI